MKEVFLLKLLLYIDIGGHFFVEINVEMFSDVKPVLNWANVSSRT